MLAARHRYNQKVRSLRILYRLRHVSVQNNQRKRGALREGGKIDLDRLEEGEWQNLFR